MKGVFIAIEGLDGSGGTTQTRRLAEALRTRGLCVHTTGEPSKGPVGRLIRRALRGEEELSDGVLPYLFAGDRRDHLDGTLLPRLEQGEWVISDRYLASSLAYQSLALPFREVAALNESFPLPDLTIFLDLAPFTCIRRIQARGQALERFERLERLEAIAEKYQQALRWSMNRGAEVLEVDASLSEEEVAEIIMGEVERLFFEAVTEG